MRQSEKREGFSSLKWKYMRNLGHIIPPLFVRYKVFLLNVIKQSTQESHASCAPANKSTYFVRSLATTWGRQEANMKSIMQQHGDDGSFLICDGVCVSCLLKLRLLLLLFFSPSNIGSLTSILYTKLLLRRSIFLAFVSKSALASNKRHAIR